MSNLRLRLVTFEQAKALAELGFPQPIQHGWFYKEGKLIYPPNEDVLMTVDYFAPSLELAAKWLREEKKIWFRIDYNHNSMPPTYSAMLFGYSLRPYINGYLCSTDGIHTKYEDVLSECIDKTIEILNKGK